MHMLSHTVGDSWISRWLYIVELVSDRSAVSRLASIRQRSRSGDSSPVCLSQRDISAGSNVVTVIVPSGVINNAGIPRSSSDSNILLDSDKLKGQLIDLTSFLLTPKLTAIIQSRWLTLFGHIMHMDNNADAKRIMLASPPADWRRQIGRTRITWLSTI